MGKNKKCAEEEPLYDSVASDEDYALPEGMVNVLKIIMLSIPTQLQIEDLLKAALRSENRIICYCSLEDN